MGTAGKARFAHRLTDDNRFESICLQCFRTVGSATLEPGLDNAEAKHVCLPEDVIRLHGRRGPESVQAGEHKKEMA